MRIDQAGPPRAIEPAEAHPGASSLAPDARASLHVDRELRASRTRAEGLTAAEADRLRGALEAACSERDRLRRELAIASREINQLRIAVAAECDLRLQAAQGWALERVEANALRAHLREIQGSRFWRYTRMPRVLFNQVRLARPIRALYALKWRLLPARCRAWLPPRAGTARLAGPLDADSRHPTA